MANITEADALTIVSLDSMRTELRIPPVDPLKPDVGTEHDALITGQIHSAANFVSRATGLALADLHLVRAAIVLATRDLYDGNREIREHAAHNAMMEPFRGLAD